MFTEQKKIMPIVLNTGLLHQIKSVPGFFGNVGTSPLHHFQKEQSTDFFLSANEPFQLRLEFSSPSDFVIFYNDQRAYEGDNVGAMSVAREVLIQGKMQLDLGTGAQFH